MNKINTSQEILDAIGCEYLELRYLRKHKMWHFVYRRVHGKFILDVENVRVFRLNELSLQQWVDIGNRLIARAESESN